MTDNVSPQRAIYRVPSWWIRFYQRLPFNIQNREVTVSFRSKIIVAITICLIYLSAAFIPLAFTQIYNLSTVLNAPSISYLAGTFMTMLGCMLGSSVSLGAAPLITGYIVYGVLTSADLLEVRSALEAHAAKFICVFGMLLIETLAFIVRPELGMVELPVVISRFCGMFPNTHLWQIIAQMLIPIIMFLQVFFMGLFIMFLDRVGEEYSFGSMVGVFIVLGVMITYAQDFGYLLTQTFTGLLPWSQVLFFNPATKGITWLAFVFSLLFVLILSILESRLLMLPFRTIEGRPSLLPYKVFFLGNIPTLLATIYLSFWGQFLQFSANFLNILHDGYGSFLYYVAPGTQVFSTATIPGGLFGFTNLAVIPGYLPGIFSDNLGSTVYRLFVFLIATIVFAVVATLSTRLWCIAEQINTEKQAKGYYSYGIRALEGRGTLDELVDAVHPFFTVSVLGSCFLLVVSMSVLNFLGPFANIPSSSLILTIGIIQGYLDLLIRRSS